MAYTQQEKARLVEILAGLPQSDRDMMSNHATSDTLEAFAEIIAAQRTEGMTSAIAAVVSGEITDMTALQAAGSLADGAATVASLQTFASALDDGSDANAILRAAVATCVAARKHFGI